MVAFVVKIITLLILFTSFCEIASYYSSLGKVLRFFLSSLEYRRDFVYTFSIVLVGFFVLFCL